MHTHRNTYLQCWQVVAYFITAINTKEVITADGYRHSSLFVNLHCLQKQFVAIVD